MALESLRIPVGEEAFVARAAGPADGALVLLLHGFPQTSWSWRHQLEVLGESGFRAVALDQRGYSPEARPRDVERYRMRHLVADVLAVVDELGAFTFHLVGHDWGAAVAWQVAGRHQDRVRTLTALSVPHPLAFGRALRGEEGSDQRSRSGYMEDLRAPGAADAFLAGGAAGLRDLYARSGLAEADVEPYVEVLTQPGAMQAALNWYAAADRSVVEGLGPITMPTLFVWSTEDPALGREAAEWTAEHVEGPFRFEVLEGVSHWIAEEAPERLNALLLEHLASR